MIWGAIMLVLFVYLANKTVNDISAGAEKRKAAIEKGKVAFQEKPAQQPVTTQQQPAPLQNTPSATQPANQAPTNSDPQAKKIHPYSGLQLHLIGSFEDFDRRGRFHKIIWIAVSRNGQMLKEITHADLALAGYQLTVLNDCMIDLSYNDKWQDYIFCDSPTQEVSFGESSTVAKN